MVPFVDMRRSFLIAGSLGAALVGTLACGDDGGGDMNPPQESVSDGTTDRFGIVDLSVAAGTGVAGFDGDALADRWTVRHDRLLVAVGTFRFTAADGAAVTHEASGVVDLLQASSPALLAAVNVPVGSAEVGFSLPVATSRFSAIGSTSAADLELMTSNGYSIYIEGTITRKDGMTCTGDAPPVCTPAPEVRFRWGVPVGLDIDDCPTLALVEGDLIEQVLTLTGDRWFRTDFQDDAEPTLRAQWIANADIDRDGETTLEELERLPAATLLRSDLGYDLRRAAPIAVTTARDFVEAQVRMMARDAFTGCKTVSAL